MIKTVIPQKFMRFCLTYPLHNIYTETYSDISDQDLDQLVRQVQQQHPGVAIRLLKGHLGSIGHRIHGDRIQLSLLRTKSGTQGAPVAKIKISFIFSLEAVVR